MDKMKMETENKTLENLAKLKEMFPEVITESKDENEEIIAAVDAKKLEQLLSTKVIEGDECYDFTWVGKKQAIVEACKPIRKTLRPCREESVDWENTQNLYIEGDNLDVLKLLQESYLNKVKMIYIDPPYNTGNDSFIYPDDYAENKDKYDEEVGAIDESGYRMFKNAETYGRFHSSWCSMMYPRLKLARNLLSENGVIFISIDDHEVDNLRKICNEIFGSNNFEGAIKWRRRSNQPNDPTKMIATVAEYCLVYAKNSNILRESMDFGTVELSEERLASYTNPDNDPQGPWSTTPWCASKGQGGSQYTITTPTGKIYNEVWLGTKETFEKHLKEGRILFTSNGNGKPRKKVYKSEAIQKGQAAIDFWVGERFGDNLNANADMKQIFGLDRVFDYSKPVNYIKTMIRIAASNKEAVVLDFFSGSATTAHAVMQLNAEDGGKRKFIMVQLPEVCDEKSEAYKAGYKNICEIGKERLRRAGQKIVEETGKTDLDIGFRVLKLDESNMKDVYFAPEKYSQKDLADMANNIKDGRTAEDLLYACMLEWGLELSLPHKVQKIAGFDVHIVNNGDLVACFADKISEDAIKQIAEMKPLRAVFRDSSFATDAVRVNVGEIFKLKSPSTTIKVL